MNIELVYLDLPDRHDSGPVMKKEHIRVCGKTAHRLSHDARLDIGEK